MSGTRLQSLRGGEKKFHAKVPTDRHGAALRLCSCVSALAAAPSTAAKLCQKFVRTDSYVDGDIAFLSDVLADYSEQPPIASRMP